MTVEWNDIRPGDRVTFAYPLRGRDTIPQTGKGKAVMRGPAGWVLNLGGPHGRPYVVSPRSFIKATRPDNQSAEAMRASDLQHGLLSERTAT